MRLAVVKICWKVSCGRTQVQGVAATDVVFVAGKIVDGSSRLGSRGLLQQVLLLLAVSVSYRWWLCLLQQLPKRLCQESVMPEHLMLTEVPIGLLMAMFDLLLAIPVTTCQVECPLLGP